MESTPIPSTDRTQTATLAGGCFWCLEAVFEQVKGVDQVVSGYTGGAVPNPTYRLVGTGTSGHAEAVQITFDPAQITYRELLEVFFSIHDPTTLNRQGADVGPQYRSAIFYHDDDQLATARQVIKEIEAARIWEDPIVTEVSNFEIFHPAEDYHQQYYQHNSGQAYCQVVISPKLAKFRKQYAAKLK